MNHVTRSKFLRFLDTSVLAPLAISTFNRTPFAPFEEEENVVRETKNFKVQFSAFTICVMSNTWRVGEQDPETSRRLISTRDDGSFSNYFYISKQQEGSSVYNIQWCPAELCPIRKFACGTVGALVENGKRLLALDGSVLSVAFERA